MPGTEVRTWRLASGSAEPSPSALWFPNGASAHPKMAWRQLLLVCCLSAAVLLTTLQEGAGASVGTQQEAGQDVREDVEQKIFMQESDASNFLKRRSKRSPKSQDEVNAENRQKLRANELRRAYYEEQRNEFENFVEEQNDEQEARSREAIEQWRQWHYDGLHPSYLYNRHHI
ncbi:putative cartilage matrix-associated protein isoform X1 [Herpailurus yagouaroundi]|uniref:putative cartilage matrix-associated protein isoform X1 n=1 Tax=Herpailurus yagouaroundi TaxID=1608482 RepID=UPI001AD700D5|nr:unique cartilage matrix-associated protein isoform X1 [Puma yagouaroundi]